MILIVIGIVLDKIKSKTNRAPTQKSDMNIEHLMDLGSKRSTGIKNVYRTAVLFQKISWNDMLLLSLFKK